MRNFDLIKHFPQQKNIIQLMVDFLFLALTCLRAAWVMVVALFSRHAFIRLSLLLSRFALPSCAPSFLNLVKQLAVAVPAKLMTHTAKSVTFLTALSISSTKLNSRAPKNHQKQGEFLEISPAKCKQLLSTALLVLGISFGGGANAAYVQNIITQTAFVVPGAVATLNSASVWTGGADDGSISVAIPFTFNYAGVGRTSVFIGTNGFLTFSAGSQAYNNSALFSNVAGAASFIPADTILPFWDDLILLAAGGTITYGTAGTAPNRQFVITWNAVRLFANQGGSQCNFQVVLGEDQTIRFRYGTSTNCTAASATTGIQENAATFIQRSFNTAITAEDVLYSPFPSLSVQKTVALICDPTNGTSNPKNIPGSISRYTVTITNTGLATASLATVGDALISFLTFDPNLVLGASAATCLSAAPGVPENAAGKGFKINVTGSTRTGYPKFLTNAADADGATFASPNVTIDYTTALPAVAGVGGYAAGELKGGESVTVIFNVTVN